MAHPVDPRQSLPELDLRVLARWRERDVARESRRRRAGAPARVIWERPAAAGDAPPLDDLPARVLADIFARYATMRGWDVERRSARECHGLAVELAAERALGLSSKEQIELHGIGELNARCREVALASAAEDDAFGERIGVQPSPVLHTLDPRYVESVWWAVKEIADQGLLYEDLKVVPWCPRCATALRDDEVAHDVGVTDPAAHVRLKVARDGGPLQAGDELLVWTTAPWTLVANGAVAVDPELTYVRAKTGALEAPVVVAEALAEQVLGDLAGVRILDRFRGAAIDGVRYEPPFGYLPAAAFGERGHTVLLASFVTASEGTGLVSVASAFGEADLRLGARYGLAVVNPVGPSGAFDERAGRYAGRAVGEAGIGLIEDLRARGRLLRSAPYEHAAPHCGYCSARVLPLARPCWYVATAQLGPQLRGAGSNGALRRPDTADRLLSRERYWGVPLPVWRCAHEHVTVVGSFDELEQRSGQRLADPHRPFVDDVSLRCECGAPATRVADIVHPWLEAGAMPFARRHEPFAGELTLDELYPADLVCDGGPRGWLSSLLTVSALLRGGEQAVEHVVRCGAPGDAIGGTRRDAMAAPSAAAAPADRGGGRHGTDPAAASSAPPGECPAREGADALRWRALTGEPADFLAELWSACALASAHPPETTNGNRAELDRWIGSRLSATIEAAAERLDSYDAPAAARAIAAFARDLCGWYVASCEERVRAGDQSARHTLRDCLVALAHLLAPFTPFVADEIYDALDGAEPSVHLTDWPVATPRDLALETAIRVTRGA